jgi:hypothetical protein
MALNYYTGFSCSSGNQAFFEIEGTIQNGAIYELLRGSTNIGCWSLVLFEQTPSTISVSVFNGPWNNCQDCQGDLTPTPTESPTQTPSQTPTNTPTNTITPTPSITTSNTPTPSITASQTPTQTSTGTPPPTPTQTQTPTQTSTGTPPPTPTQTQTPTNTATQTNTPTNTSTRTPTPTTTLTNTPTPSITASPTATTTATPTPTPTPFGVFYVDVQYEAEACITCSGVTYAGDYPHPSDWVPENPNGGRQGVVVDLSAVQLGGMHGLNN